MTLETIKILVCDDSILARKKLKDYLITLGCQNLFEAADGKAAVDNYKTNHPDIVFLDIVMPVKDGITTVKEIIEFDSNAKIVMTSSVGTQEHLKEALKAGAVDFIQKPLDNEQIKSAIINRIEGGR